jgi:uncharacterized YccA/Bax inhibitor family protein
MIRSSNPALNDKVFRNLAWDPATRMTLQGTVVKSAVLLLLVVAGASWTWNLFFTTRSVEAIYPYVAGGFGGGLVIALITIFKKRWAPFTAPLYAVVEGLALGALSALIQARFPDVPIVAQAAGLTFATFGGLLLAYSTGLIKPTENFKLGVFAATSGIFFVYIISWVLGMFGVAVPYLHDSGPIGIGVSVFVCVIAALNLVLDFDFIENGVDRGAPKWMEWYASFGLLVTLVWLYVEFLRLLTKLNSRN